MIRNLFLGVKKYRTYFLGFLLLSFVGLFCSLAFARFATEVGVKAGVSDNKGNGGAWGDYDNDGYFDLYLASNGANRLYHNNRDGTFTDVAVRARVADAGDSRGVAWGDYDNDGYLDLYVANNGTNRLYHNNRDGTFMEVGASAGVNHRGDGQCIAWGDYDGDGDIDLYLSNHLNRNCLYKNNGDGTFTDVAASAGVADGSHMYSRGVAWGDYNNDGHLDLYLASCGANARGGPNRLYRNNGDGTFTDMAVSAGVADSRENGTAVAWGDYDNNGYLDLCLSNYQQVCRLYRNKGDGTFEDVADATRVAGISGGGVAWGDYDNDGHLDIFLVGKRIHLYRNNGDGTFTDEAINERLSTVTGGDYDNDGDLDLYVINRGGMNLLFQNNQNDDNFLFVRPLDEKGRLNRHGTIVRIFRAGTNALVGTRIIDGGSSYYSQNAYDAHFGLPSAGTYDIEVNFPGGTVIDKNTNPLLGNVRPANTHYVEVRQSSETILHPASTDPTRVQAPPSDVEALFSDDFEDGDVSDWNSGYYKGEADLDGKLSGTPAFATSADASASGKFGLRFTKNRTGNYITAIVSSPKFGPLTSRFQVDFDIVPDKYQHIVWLGEAGPFETHNERQISRFGIYFSKGKIGLRGQGFPALGQYNPNSFYRVTMVAEPLSNLFDVTVTGPSLRNAKGNPVDRLTMTNQRFEIPMSAGGIRRINLWAAPTYTPDSTVGLDNVVVRDLSAAGTASPVQLKAKESISRLFFKVNEAVFGIETDMWSEVVQNREQYDELADILIAQNFKVPVSAAINQASIDSSQAGEIVRVDGKTYQIAYAKYNAFYEASGKLKQRIVLDKQGKLVREPAVVFKVFFTKDANSYFNQLSDLSKTTTNLRKMADTLDKMATWHTIAQILDNAQAVCSQLLASAILKQPVKGWDIVKSQLGGAGQEVERFIVQAELRRVAEKMRELARLLDTFPNEMDYATISKMYLLYCDLLDRHRTKALKLLAEGTFPAYREKISVTTIKRVFGALFGAALKKEIEEIDILKKKALDLDIPWEIAEQAAKSAGLLEAGTTTYSAYNLIGGLVHTSSRLQTYYKNARLRDHYLPEYSIYAEAVCVCDRIAKLKP